MRLVYFVLFPLDKKLSEGDRTRLKGLKRGPHFLNINIGVQVLGRKDFDLEGKKIFEECYIYDDKVLISQFTYDVGTEISEGLIEKKSKINSILRKKALLQYSGNEQFLEEYSVLLVKKSGNIEEFIEANKFVLARLIRSLDKKIQSSDADEVLVSRVAYSKEDVAVVDWEGAILVDSEGDFEEQLELIRVGNYQLLRYRILDSEIEGSLLAVRKAIKGPRSGFMGNTLLRSTVENKLSLLLDFDGVDQSLLLVGDWYSSKLYKIIIEEFYIDDWRDLVRNKLDSLEAIDTTARENLTLSWSRILDLVQIIGWAILLVGYFLLYLKDARVF